MAHRMPLFRQASSGSSSEDPGRGPVAGPSRTVAAARRTKETATPDSASSSSEASDDEAPISRGAAYVIEHDASAPSLPHLVEVRRSDGVRTNWPKPGPFSDSKGAPCTWVVQDDGSALKGRWMTGLGKALAERMGWISGPSQDWRLKDFPANYRLYTHVKGEREDHYLYGSSVVTKFRTVNEFLPHLENLCRNDGRACQCKYCSGTKRQSVVNTQLGISTELHRSDSQERRPKPRRRSKEASHDGKRGRGSAPVDDLPAGTPPLERESPAPYDGGYVAKDRDRDLSGIHSPFRQGEMVWAKLDRPIGGNWHRRVGVEIEYWPAICELRELVTRGTVAATNGSGRAGQMIVDGEFRPDSSVGLKVSQRFCWKVRLLGLADSLLREEKELLPWLNYPPAEELFKVPLDGQRFIDDWRADSTNRPALSQLVDLSIAITPFALALQIAAHVVSFWNLHDRFDMPSIEQFKKRGIHLDEATEAAITRDAQNAWFQSLWWGAEKIWAGELVRLVVGAKGLPPDVNKPVTQDDERAFFLKVTGIYRGLDDRPVVKGPIYELAPADARAPNDDDGPQLKYMPAAPPGYFFRCLTRPREELHLALEHIAGRYYPPNQLVFPPDPVSDPTAPRTTGQQSRSLCGLATGGSLHMKTQMWVFDRKEALKKSERTAEEDMTRYFSERDLASHPTVRPQVDAP